MQDPDPYRADIDGLRALAVVAVLIHHLSATWLPGGFVGVDVFFVISGFLITRQIVGQIEARRFSAWHFYRRRVNRIAPALFCVIVASYLAGLLLLSPAEWVRLANSGVSAMTGLSNFYFWSEYGNYFARPSGEAILLHTWSLGVEEQFYLAWPWLMIGLVRLGRPRLAGLLALLTLLGALASQYAAGLVASASFYLLPTRLFELTLGAALAVAPRPDRPLGRGAAVVAQAAGLALIGWALLTLNRGSRLPGFNALLPCLGAALLIWVGHRGRPSPLLSSRPAIVIGQRSYSLYLWHWPIVAYSNYLDIEIGWPQALTIALVSLLLAALSWRWVEQPMRRDGATWPVVRVIGRRLLLPILVLLAVALISQRMHGWPGRFPAEVARFEAMAESHPNELRAACHVPGYRYRDAPQAVCTLGAERQQIDGLLVGDSFANHFSGMVDVLAHHDGVRLIDYTMDGCLPMLAEGVPSEPHAARCQWRNRHWLERVRTERFRYVVLGGQWPTGDAAQPTIEAVIDAVIDAGARPIVILRNQTIPRAASCPVRSLILHRDGDCGLAQDPRPAYWAQIQARHPQLRFIDPNEVICDAGRCRPLVDGILLYRDGGHLNDIGARLIGRRLIDRGRSLLIDP